MWSKLPLKFGKEDGKEVDFGHGRDRRIIPPHKIFGRVWNFYRAFAQIKRSDPGFDCHVNSRYPLSDIRYPIHPTHCLILFPHSIRKR